MLFFGDKNYCACDISAKIFIRKDIKFILAKKHYKFVYRYIRTSI